MRTMEQNRRAEIAYDTAYFVVPQYALGDYDHFAAVFERKPDQAALFYYLLAARGRGREAHADDISRVKGHTGRFDSDREWYAIEYPTYPAFDVLSGGAVEFPDPSGPYVLAPYFSAVVVDREERKATCFVLGQSPDAQTTLRAETLAMNANLGPGCEPELKVFVDFLCKRIRLR